MSQLWGSWTRCLSVDGLASLAETAVPSLCSGGDSARRQGSRSRVRQGQDSQSWGKSLFSDLNRLRFYCFNLQRVKREIRARAFNHLFTLLPNGKCFIRASTLDVCKSREWPSERTSTVSALLVLSDTLGEKTKQRDSRHSSCQARKNHFLPDPGSIFLFLSVDSHLTPRTVKCLEMKNLKKDNYLKKIFFEYTCFPGV